MKKNAIRAKELVGDSAFIVDEDGEIFLKPKWARASEAMYQAGFSYESNNLLTESEKQILRKPLIEVMN